MDISNRKYVFLKMAKELCGDLFELLKKVFNFQNENRIPDEL